MHKRKEKMKERERKESNRTAPLVSRLHPPGSKGSATSRFALALLVVFYCCSGSGRAWHHARTHTYTQKELEDERERESARGREMEKERDGRKRKSQT